MLIPLYLPKLCSFGIFKYCLSKPEIIKKSLSKHWLSPPGTFHISIENFSYRTRAIISRGLYIFYPIFKDHYFVFKEVFSENSVLMYGLYSRVACNQERLMMARVRYFIFLNQIFLSLTFFPISELSYFVVRFLLYSKI